MVKISKTAEFIEDDQIYSHQSKLCLFVTLCFYKISREFSARGAEEWNISQIWPLTIFTYQFILLRICFILHPFHTTDFFIYLLKTSENQSISTTRKNHSHRQTINLKLSNWNALVYWLPAYFKTLVQR